VISPAVSAPSPESQLEFLAKLQRLFAEGDFSATYKFALLVSLADLAVELGADDMAEVTLTHRQIAERFVGLYWHHTTLYGKGRPGTQPGVLVQNLGTQAAVLTAIARFRAAAPAASFQQARGAPGFIDLIGQVSQVVSAQPVKYLQNFGGATYDFLYERVPGAIRLRPGVAYCLRRFYPLVQQLSRTHWADHIKANRQNHAILGDSGDLEDFLFSSSRQSLAIVCTHLRKLDDGRCFYCGGRVEQAEVDHFIPFSSYPRDMAHNFVLAHTGCNRSKSDTLAAKPHLARWLERLQNRSSDLHEIGELAGIASDRETAHRVAAWGYANASAVAGRAWISASQYEAVDQHYLALLGS